MKGYTYFSYFASKHRLFVLVRTASVRRFLHVRTIYVLSKNKKNIIFFPLKIFISYNLKHRCILHGHVFVMQRYHQFLKKSQEIAVGVGGVSFHILFTNDGYNAQEIQIFA